MADDKTSKIIATSSPWKVLNYVVEKFSLGEYFEVKVSGEDVVNPKPAPDIYKLTAEKLKKDTEDCIVLEDSLNGSKSAKAAGMYVIGVENEYVKRSEFMDVDDACSQWKCFISLGSWNPENEDCLCLENYEWSERGCVSKNRLTGFVIKNKDLLIYDRLIMLLIIFVLLVYIFRKKRKK